MTFSQDQKHISKVLNGDTKAFAYLVNSYKDFVYTIAINIVKNSQDAEDIAQETFVKAFKQLHTFNGKSKFSTWLYTITFRTAISSIRKSKLDTNDIDDYVVSNYGDDGLVSQLKFLQQEDQKKYIKIALANLTEMDSLVLTLYYLHENTTEEIEEITGLNKNNIKVRIYRARKKLAESLRRTLPKEYVLWK